MNFKSIKNVVKSSVFKCCYHRPRVMTSEQTVNYVLENHCSLGRLGDGELFLTLNYDIGFQKANEKLTKRILSLKTTENFLLCIPDIFYSNKLLKKQFITNSYKFWEKHKFCFEGYWRKYYSHCKICGDTAISRFYLRFKDKTHVSAYVHLLKKIWHNRNITFVEGEHSRLGVGNDLFSNAKSIKRILCPATNAFDKYETILQTIKQNVNKEDLLILALGPTAAVLAYDLSELGYQALDLGHIDIEYEWFLMGAQEKVPIPHKHVNECNSMGDESLGRLQNEYEKQIIAKVL